MEKHDPESDPNRWSRAWDDADDEIVLMLWQAKTTSKDIAEYFKVTATEIEDLIAALLIRDRV